MLLASTMLSGIPVARAADTPPAGLETVVVTAQKREENLQRVPMNVQAITTQRLQELHLTDFTDFQMFMPSVTFAVSGQGSNGGPGFANITMRGIASDQNGNHSGPVPTVGVYLDEQPITTINGTLDVPTYDIQRVEALSGPQGTLYGASAESGVIRIITNKPDPSGFAAGYEVEGNAVEHGGLGYRVNGFINHPITDKIAIRLVAWDEHDAGYIDNVHGTRTYTFDTSFPPLTLDNASRVKNDYNTVDKFGGRAALGIELDENWTITPSIIAQWERSNGVFGYNKGNSFGYNRPLGDLEVIHFQPEFAKDNWYQAALTVQGKIADLDVLYSGGHMDRRINSQADYTDYTFWYDQVFPSSVDFYDNAGNQIDPSQTIIGKDHFTKDSHELRISNAKDNRFRFVLGAFYERQSHFILQDYVIKNLNTLSFDQCPYAHCSVDGWPGTLWLTDQMRIDRDYAVFGEVSYDILPTLTITGGVRVFKADNSLQGFFGFQGYEFPPPVQCFAPPSVDHGPCTNVDEEVKETGETHRLNLTWQITPDQMVYATYSTGFRPGGVNRRTDLPGVGAYNSDTLDNYEIGWKTSWNDNRLRFNGAFFLEDWNQFQFPFLGPNSVTIIANAGQARVKGVETEISWLPIDQLTLNGSAAYTNAELATPYCGGDCADPKNKLQAPAGTQLPITPMWKLNGTARYQWRLWDDWLAHVQASVVHEGGRWADLRLAERALLGKSKEFTTLDVTTGIEKDNWSLELALLNATDERAQLGRYAECTPGTCGPQTYILPARPRTVALTFSQKF
ncbi:MAG: TonB-dependent receptor [Alphaproteobacteria bacterium]|nr:TonB-dependent receptor [Alphaproteobacteria bacterium]